MNRLEVDGDISKFEVQSRFENSRRFDIFFECLPWILNIYRFRRSQKLSEFLFSDKERFENKRILCESGQSTRQNFHIIPTQTSSRCNLFFECFSRIFFTYSTPRPKSQAVECFFSFLHIYPLTTIHQCVPSFSLIKRRRTFFSASISRKQIT
jgi:hypothetical protein